MDGRYIASKGLNVPIYDFDRDIDRRQTDSVKWRKYKNRDIIPMWVADMDFLSPPAVLEALHNRVAHGVFGYSEPGDELIEVVVSFIEKAYDWRIKPNWIVWLPGLVAGLNVACRAVGRSDESIITILPTYPPFLSAPKLAGKTLKTSPMRFTDNAWSIDFDHLSDIMDSSSAMFILCNPHNPTGRVFSHQELMQLTDLVLKNGMVVCSDEIHCDLVLEPGHRHTPIASIHEQIAERSITLMAPSKTFNIPGVGCGFAIIPNEKLRRCFRNAMAGIVPHVTALGYTAARAAYGNCADWLSELLIYLRRNRDLVYDAINDLEGLSMGRVQATYLAWIDARKLYDKDAHIVFEEAGVGLSPGVDFGAPGFVRLNFGCTHKTLSMALKRMRAVVSQAECR